MKKVSLILVFIVLFVEVASLEAKIYKYVDSEGVIHFTDSPPVSAATVVHETRTTEKPVRVRERRLTKYDYLRIAEEKADRYGLNPELVKSVIEVESAWNPYARSKRGALGLMQLMPETARELGVHDPFDPVANIDGGTRYLKYLIDRFGDLKLALAAYNAGPTVVEKYGKIPPIRETRDYVRRVLVQYQGDSGASSERIYKVILKDGTTMFTNTPFYPDAARSF
ncbi:MAG: DUF4124 domain-containing protein [Nitrospirae bacterium]|nr:MAG: DUF4124 domain-containing protein [Nitrospirota bacterium]